VELFLGYCGFKPLVAIPKFSPPKKLKVVIMTKFHLFLALIALFSGCASTHMERYVGKDIREVILDSGPPVNALDLDGGRRAFQFRWGGGTFLVPSQTTTTGQINVTGNTAWLQSRTLSTGGGIISSEGCIVTYITTFNAAKQSWIVESYRIPKQLVC
jgi:hypothetical protein